MDGLLGKILKDLEKVPERKLDLQFEDIPHAYPGEKSLGSLNKLERQIFCLYRDVLLKIDAMLAKVSDSQSIYEHALPALEGEHRIVHPLDSEALLLYQMLFSTVRYRLPASVHTIVVCRGGKIVEAVDERSSMLDSIMSAVLERNPQHKKTLH